MKILVQHILAFCARWVLKKHKPKIIALTGSVGKTTTKDAIYTVLKDDFKVLRNVGNFNNEFGVPLTVLELQPAQTGPGWLGIVWRAFKKALSNSPYYDLLILETGIDHPGDMTYLTKIFQPDLAIFTGVSTVHLEFFENLDQLAAEKEVLLQAVPQSGVVLLNADNPYARKLADKYNHLKVISYGLSSKADYWASDIKNTLTGIDFVLQGKRINNIDSHLQLPGKHQLYAILAAVVVGLEQGLSLERILEQLKAFKLSPGRLSVISGINKTTLLDSTYNAEPASMNASLDLLRELPGQRKIAVLGDMLELGSAEENAHDSILKRLMREVDIAFLIGPRFEKALSKLSRSELKIQTYLYDTAFEAIEPLQKQLHEGDLVLLKGSQGMRVEKITKALMKHPEKAAELLVRQSEKWLNK